MRNMRVLYYPGCSLKNSYPEFEKSAEEVCKKLNIDLEEIPEWNCCGVNFSLADDNIMRHLGAIRTFINAQEEGMAETENSTIVTLCSMCYNVLKRVNMTLKEEPDTLENVNDFIEDQPNYQGNLKVVHFLGLLRDQIGLEELAKTIEKPLEGVKIAPYYGCALLRPEETSIDDSENPSILESVITTLGGEVVDYPFKIECCGNYHSAFKKEIVEARSQRILNAALSSGADLVLSPCPLCTYNLKVGSEALGKEIPVLFFTQILALAMGTNPHFSSDMKEKDFFKMEVTNV